MKEESSGKIIIKWMWIIIAFSVLDLLIHLYSNLCANYGFFRDEFYYIACSKRLAAGYVDQPPLSIYILALSRLLFGDSLFAIRLLPALSSAVTVFITGLMVKKLNGKNTALVIACVSLIAAPIFLATNTFYSMNSFDWLLWSLTAYLIIVLIQDKKEKLWIWIGIVMGLGLLNKVGFLWLGFGFAVGLLFTSERKYLKTRWPYLAAVIALLIFSPFIIWNLTHNMAHLEFIRNATSEKYSSLNAISFIAGLFLILNPLTAAVWLSGIYYFFFQKDGKQIRILGIIFLVSFIILIINGHSKSEYLAPAFPMLFAGGGIMFEKWSRLKFGALIKYPVPAIIFLSLVFLSPLAIPILPVEKYINYTESIGLKPSSSENKELDELPQFYADMFGWENMASTVSKVYSSLPPEEQENTVVFTQNYGEAGAIEYYSKKYKLPPVISGHNNYWLWGYGNATKNSIIIIVGGNKTDHLKSFNSVEEASVIKCAYAMPYENNLPVYICQGLKRPVKDTWPSAKHYE